MCERLGNGSNHMDYRHFGWFLPTEPQMVFALVQQLDHLQRKIRLYRVNALLTALQKASYVDGADRSHLPILQLDAVREIRAEKITEDGKRIDLYVAGVTSGRLVEALVEFKLGHSITPGQLQSYTVDDRGCEASDVVLVVTAPLLTKSDCTQMLLANAKRPPVSRWGFIDLRHLLLEYASALPVEYDDEEFSRVRRSLQTVTEGWYS